MYTDPRRAKAFSGRLLRWYDRNGRDLPWRRTRDPYAVLVSEVMLQQTQVARVLPAYASFLKRFPTLRVLARAPLGDVLRAWRGLGYNRRARDLHRSARACPDRLPADAASLDLLPGVGAYTAAAVACFANGERLAFADTNIRRVLGRVMLGRAATQREAIAIDGGLLPRDAARWHHALMDLGATICRSRAPRCDSCPVAVTCRGRGRVSAEPRRRQSPFAASDRRVRGQILDQLREKTSTIVRLRREIGDARVDRLLGDLANEGLVEIRGTRCALPS